MAQVINSLRDISQDYDALFVDLWGCVHDGVKPFPQAVSALRAYRAGGAKVILVTNSPRPRAGVHRQLSSIGVPDDAWDDIATSGDSARAALYEGVVGRRVWFMGQPAEKAFFTPPRVIESPIDVELVALSDAEGIVCCGPRDPLADPTTWRPELELARDRGLKLLCANPDIVVDRGAEREWCAGAIARLYTQIGGESLYFGKPHAPIYDLARRRLSALGVDVPDGRILAIGDGILTDVRGGEAQDIATLFVTGGLATIETKTRTDPDPVALEAYLRDQTAAPAFAIGLLR